MRWLKALLLTLALPIGPMGASPGDVEADLTLFRGLPSRDDGSAGERAAFSHITGRLDELGILYRISPQKTIDGGHSFSSNLSAVIPGRRPGTLILAAPVDGGAFGLAFLLEMADHFQTNAPVHDIQLLFLGAERGDSAYHPYGSRSAAPDAAQADDDRGRALIYLNSEDVPSRWRLRPGGNGTVTPRWLVEAVSEVFTGQFAQFRLRGTDIQLARLGLQGDISLLEPWLEADIPSIMLTGRGTAAGNDRFRQIERLRKSLTDLDARMDGIPDNSQSAYIYFRPVADMNPVVIPELPYVIVFLSLSAVLLVAILARYRDVTLNMRRFASRLWAWPLLSLLVFLFFFLATLFIEETLLLADFPELWRTAPGTFVFFKLSIAAALSLNFILITRGLPLPRSPHFYSYMAVVTSGLATLVFIALDITVAGYSVITVVFLLLFIAVRNIRWKAVLLLLSAVPYLAAVTVIITEPYELLIEQLLLSRIGGNILMTLILMPLILGITSLAYWRLHYHKTRSGILTQSATFILTMSALVTLVWILNMNPYDEPGSRQPVTLTDSIDLNTGNRRLEISSPTSIGEAELSLEGLRYPLEGLGRQAEVRTPQNRRPLKISHSGNTFLGRRTIRVTISGEAAPDALRMLLYSPDPFTLHDSDYPFEISADGTSAVIFVGNHPPFPLTMEFTVNGDADISLDCEAIWRHPTDPPGIDRTDLLTETGRVARLTTSFE